MHVHNLYTQLESAAPASALKWSLPYRELGLGNKRQFYVFALKIAKHVVTSFFHRLFPSKAVTPNVKGSVINQIVPDISDHEV